MNMFKRMTSQSKVATTGAVVLLALLSGCRVGPPYHVPTAPTATAPNYKESTVNFQDADGWKVASPQDAMIRGKWWEIFHEPELNGLEEQLNVDNQNIKVSFENFMEARALIAEARSQYWPTITLGASWSRSRSSGNLHNSSQANGGQASTLWSAPVSVSWTPDFWGKIRNEVRSAEYMSQVSAADLSKQLAAKAHGGLLAAPGQHLGVALDAAVADLLKVSGPTAGILAVTAVFIVLLVVPPIIGLLRRRLDDSSDPEGGDS